MPERTPKRVRRITLAQLIEDAKRRTPNAVSAKLVKRKGRMEVQVEVKNEEERQ